MSAAVAVGEAPPQTVDTQGLTLEPFNPPYGGVFVMEEQRPCCPPPRVRSAGVELGGGSPGGPWVSWALTIDSLGFRRAAALQEGLRQAVAVPLALAETVASLWPALQELAQCANLACRSDLQVWGGQ